MLSLGTPSERERNTVDDHGQPTKIAQSIKEVLAEDREFLSNVRKGGI
jgi:hypothetical protein